MSFKIVVVCAFLAAVSCARVDNEQLNLQIMQQQELVQQQNDRIRDHQNTEMQQRQNQLRELEDQNRVQEQMIRDQQQKRFDNIHSNSNGNMFFTAHRQRVPASVQIVNVPSSRRNFEYIDNSNYNFAYAVGDMTTGDIKSQQEVRSGDQVQGQYSMMDADGYQRIVDYRADDQNGFDAEVRREPAVISPKVVRIDGYAPQYYYYHQQPAVHFYSAQQPLIYASTSVTRRDDAQRSHYTSTTASNF